MTASRSKNFFSAAVALTLFWALNGVADSTISRVEVTFQTKVKVGEGTLQLAMPAAPLGPVTALAFSPDGKLLAAGGYRTVTLWDLSKGSPSRVISDLAGQVQSVSFNPAGTHLAVSGGEPGKSGQAHVFDLADSARKTFLLSHTDVVNHISWSADGKWLATASSDKSARVWAWPGGLVRTILRGHTDSVTRACFSPDAQTVYTASADRNIRRYDTAKGTLLKTYGGSGDAISALAISPDGKRLVSSGAENRIRWWNTEGSETFRFSDGSGAEVNELLFTRDGSHLISAGGDKNVRIWRTSDGGHARQMSDSADWIYAAAIRPDLKLVAAGSADGLVRIWENETIRLRAVLASEGEDWLALTPEGYFAGSQDWQRGIQPRVKGKGSVELSRFVNLEMVATALKPADIKVAEIPAAGVKSK